MNGLMLAGLMLAIPTTLGLGNRDKTGTRYPEFGEALGKSLQNKVQAKAGSLTYSKLCFDACEPAMHTPRFLRHACRGEAELRGTALPSRAR